jgi:hypothetical protein
MSTQITGQAQGVVLSTSQKAGAPAAVSTGWHNELVKSDLLPRFAYLGLNGLIFGATFASAATAAASATATGAFALFNPSNSGKNLVLLDALASLTTVVAATTVLQIGYQPIPNQTPTAQTATTVISNLLVGSGNLSVAKALTAGTVVGAPTATVRSFASFYMDLAAGDQVTSVRDQLDGALIIAPGSTVAIVSVANTPTINLSLTWAELPI